MILKEGEINLEVGIDNYAHCDECFTKLSWELHNAGDVWEYWVAFCQCQDRQMWQMSVSKVNIKKV